MIHVLAMGLPLAAGLALALLAARRRWAPPLWAALAVGAALRAVVMLIAAQDAWQPYDLAVDFPATADAVLDGKDPLFELREGGWHFLPLLAYLLAGVRALGDFVGLPWEITGRLVPVLADLALIPLVARLSADPTPRVRALRGFQYACAPPVLVVAALHGQFGPITLALGVAALLAARNGRVHLAGVLIGLSVTSANWSALLLPGILLAVPALRHRLTVLVWTAAVPIAFLLSSVPVFGTPVDRLPATLSASLSARPVVGDWGWTAIATGGEQVVAAGYGTVGTPVLALSLLAALWWWRRADPVDLTLALLLVFLIVTYRFGAQYLAWPIPYLIMRSGRGTWPAITVCLLWGAFGYLYMTRLDPVAWGEAHVWWALSSLVVIAFLIRALPDRKAVS
ncbi:glycosyltransferase 87 family protein [Spirillospora sp. NPDC048819]|uniref:glycosyltransferase 87 family protein n=1 Tax=Spirillospora sp. NPDC048819 TaxID=3155268 RepID=UPI0033E7786C